MKREPVKRVRSAGAPRGAEALLAAAGEETLALVNSVLERHRGIPAKLAEAMRYSLLAGGKRLRPALVLESFSGCDGNAARRRSAVAAAAAIEMVHTFSLIHDDLPAMDDDDLRRGRPTCHKVFGEATAILAGDALLALAFEVLADDADCEIAPLLVSELARASGAAGMVGGQQLDIESENRVLELSQLQQLHRRKTGALLIAACRLGAIAAGAGPLALERVTRFGTHLGLAFQIVDDLLDVTGSAKEVGKRTGKDASRGKNTYPALLGVAESRREARLQLAAALEALVPLGRSAEPLRVLARFVVQRRR